MDDSFDEYERQKKKFEDERVQYSKDAVERLRPTLRRSRRNWIGIAAVVGASFGLFSYEPPRSNEEFQDEVYFDPTAADIFGTAAFGVVVGYATHLVRRREELMRLTRYEGIIERSGRI